LLLKFCSRTAGWHKKTTREDKESGSVGLFGYCCGVVFVSSAWASGSSMGFGGGVVAIV